MSELNIENIDDKNTELNSEYVESGFLEISEDEAKKLIDIGFIQELKDEND